MKIEKITNKPPVFDAVQQTYGNVADIKKWLEADELFTESELDEHNNLTQKITYVTYVREPGDESKVYSERRIETMIYDAEEGSGFSTNDWIVKFAEGVYQVVKASEMQQLYVIKSQELPKTANFLGIREGLSNG